MSFTIEVDNAAVLAAFNRLIHAGEDLNPVMRAIGEDIVKRAKQRFETSTAPDGTAWAPNSDTTLRAMLHSNGKNFTKKGGLSARGGKALAGKKPLIGESGYLARQIDYALTGNSVTVTADPKYAAIQQFGGKKSQFPKLWGDIPARPFIPVTATGQLYPNEEHAIIAVINAHLQKSISG